FFSRDVIVEMSGYGSRQYGGDFYIILSHVLHQCLTETDQTKFAGIISGTARKEVDPGETGDGDHITFGFFDRFECSFDTVKYAGEIGVQSLIPLIFRKIGNISVMTDPGIGDQYVQPAP